MNRTDKSVTNCESQLISNDTDGILKGIFISSLESIFVFLISLLLAFYLWSLQQPAHVLQLSSDQNNIASFAAASKYPQRYSNDMLLSDSSNFKWYTPVYVKLIQWLKELTGSYASAFISLIIPTVTLFLSGSYFLLRYICQSRILAGGLSFLFTVVWIKMPLGGAWDMLYMRPNTQFTALLPWVLLLSSWALNRQKLWPLCTASAASLIYVHPVSAPAWGFAIFGGLLFNTKNLRKDRRKLYCLGISVILAVMIILPFFFIYLGASTNKQVSDEQYDTVYKYALKRLVPGCLETGVAIKNFIQHSRKIYMRRMTYFMLLWAICGQLFAWWRTGRARTLARFMLFGLLFFLCITLLAPFIDQIISARLRKLPFQIDLIRGLKFWPFWLLLLGAPGYPVFCDFVCKRLGNRFFVKSIVSIVIIAIALIVCNNLILRHRTDFLATSATNIDFKRKMQATDELVQFIDNELPENATFIGKCKPIWLRHTPGRAVFLTWKDSGAFLLGNTNSLLTYIDRLGKLNNAKTFSESESLFKGWGVDYILVSETDDFTVDRGKIVFSNSMWKLIQVSSNHNFSI